MMSLENNKYSLIEEQNIKTKKKENIDGEKLPDPSSCLLGKPC